MAGGTMTTRAALLLRALQQVVERIGMTLRAARWRNG